MQTAKPSRASRKRLTSPLAKDIRRIRRRVPSARMFIEEPLHAELLAQLEDPARRHGFEKAFEKNLASMLTKSNGLPKWWAVRLQGKETRAQAVDVAMQLSRHALSVLRNERVTSNERTYQRHLDRIQGAISHARRKVDLRVAQAKHRLAKTQGLDNMHEERVELHQGAERGVLDLFRQYVEEERSDLPTLSRPRARVALKEAVLSAIIKLGRLGFPPRAILQFLNAEPVMSQAGYMPSKFYSLATVKKTLQRKIPKTP
jgi:hypothetical protein